MFKICSMCRVEKDINLFFKDKNRKDGCYPICKNCRKPYYKLHKKLYKDKIKKYTKEYYLKNKNKFSEQSKSLNGRFKTYKKGAKKRNLLFLLTIEEFEKITSQVCFYCENFSKDRNYCGIDRIDNDVGYIFENCTSCCFECNDIKSNSTFDQIEKIYLGILKLRKLYNEI